MKSVLISSMRSFRGETVYSRLLRSLRDDGTKVAVVSANAGEEDFVREICPGVEFVPRGLGSWPPALRVERPIPEIVSKLMVDSDYIEFKHSVMTSLDRHDATGTFRMIDRELYFMEAFTRLASILVKNSITHVYFDITPHVATEYILYWVATKLRLKIIFFQPVPFAGFSLMRSTVSDFWDWSSNPILGPQLEDFRRFVYGQFEALTASLLGGNAKWVQKFQSSEIKKLSEKRFRFRKLTLAISNWDIPKNFVHFSGDSITPNWARVLLFKIMTYVLRASFQKQRLPQRPGDIAGRKDLLFAMTHQPERTFFPEALPHTSQLEVLLEVREIFKGYDRVLVKEHDTQFAPGRLGFAARSPGFYAWLKTIPNVETIPSSSSSLPYVRGCGGVVSATGTICVEAALLGTPAYFYGNPWWDGFPGTTKIKFDGSKVQLGSQKPVPPQEADLRDFFQQLLGRSAITTSNIESQEFESKFAKLPGGYESLEVEFLHSVFRKFLSQ